MPAFKDGPSTNLFRPISLKGDIALSRLKRRRVSKKMKAVLDRAPSGNCVCFGIPFKIGKVVVLQKKAFEIKLPVVTSRWLAFMHTADVKPAERDEKGFPKDRRGRGGLGECAARYVFRYADGKERSVEIRRRHQIGMFSRGWGESCFEAVAHRKPHALPLNPKPEHKAPWGRGQTRGRSNDADPFGCWLWAWENPRPGKAVVSVRLEPVDGTTLVFAVSAGDVGSNPLRWERRRKGILRLPRGEKFAPSLDEKGMLRQIRLDMGQIVLAQARTSYPNERWSRTTQNDLPEKSKNEVFIEYTSHPEATFHLEDGTAVPVRRLEEKGRAGRLRVVAPAHQRIRLKVVEKGSRKSVPVKLHLHGESSEYLAPVDRHRQANLGWFEDYAPEFGYKHRHLCTYIDGETVLDVPLGNVYIEVTKGFEIKPIRKRLRVSARTKELSLEIEKVLDWRERGWVTADTHVHFLSPTTARLEGCAEGVNVVNLLASQWGELMTNVGDFDGRTTLGAGEGGGEGEWLVRVGTENRQHVLGHISLLGYEGRIIAPMCAGGPDEAAIGDPVDVLLTEWARQCRKQGGLVVFPHFPNPRAEHAAAIANGLADGIEMTSWNNLYAGIDPYSLGDWYRYLNCGFHVPAVAGTDKMTALTPVGAIRTYARIDPNRPLSYEAWKDAVRSGGTFVTYGPLVEFSVDGAPAGQRIAMSGAGGTVDVEWRVASVTMPMTRVELVVNGEIQESVAARKREDAGRFRVRLDRSAWVALLVRARYPGKKEMIGAHTSAVMVDVAGTPYFSKADAVSILEQIEGALAYLDTIGTRAATRRYKAMRLELQSAHRRLHNRMHQNGEYHQHGPATDHAEHHGR